MTQTPDAFCVAADGRRKIASLSTATHSSSGGLATGRGRRFQAPRRGAAALVVSARRACDGARRLGARRSELGGDLLGRRGEAASRRGGSMAVGARPRDDLPGEAECARRGEASPRWPAVRRARGGRGSGSGCEIWRRSAGRRCGARGGRKRATGRKGTGGWILYFCVACWRRKYLGT